MPFIRNKPQSETVKWRNLAQALRIQEPLTCKKAADYLEDESVEEESDGGEEGDE